jgi:membrane protein implicated in regulation of membrane protease activity
MLGIAAFGAAGAAWLGYDFAAQVIVASVVAGVGCYAVHVYREKNKAEQMPPIDAGMPANFESWIDAGARLARVRYRGASWDARVEGAEALEPGATVYVLAADGNTLKVAKNRP